ncbi:hypothetical protein BANRA_05073 [Klebsiella pneumoniae]|nr:hypothetical protein BANRA_05073 [Klebsiella pneumoniae]
MVVRLARNARAVAASSRREISLCSISRSTALPPHRRHSRRGSARLPCCGSNAFRPQIRRSCRPTWRKKRFAASSEVKVLPPPASPVPHRHCAAASKTAAIAPAGRTSSGSKASFSGKATSIIRVPGKSGKDSPRPSCKRASAVETDSTQTSTVVKPHIIRGSTAE